MLWIGTEIDALDAEPGLALELGRGDPKLPAFLHALHHLCVQTLRFGVAEVAADVADADGGHGRLIGRFEFRMLGDEGVQVPRLTDVVVDPLADLAGAVAFEAHPDLEAAEAARLLEAADIILVALLRVLPLLGEGGRV